MSGLFLSHYNFHLTSTRRFDDICLDYLYHAIECIWHLLPRLNTYVFIIFISLWLTSDIYFHVWLNMSQLSLSHYELHLTYTTTFNYILSGLSLAHYNLPLTIYFHGILHMAWLSLSHYTLHLTSTTTFDDICLDYLYNL